MKKERLNIKQFFLIDVTRRTFCSLPVCGNFIAFHCQSSTNFDKSTKLDLTPDFIFSRQFVLFIKAADDIIRRVLTYNGMHIRSVQCCLEELEFRYILMSRMLVRAGDDRMDLPAGDWGVQSTVKLT